MGTRPEDMQYRVERDAVSGVPWLVADRDSVWEWVAPVHVLRVALQQKERWERQVAKGRGLVVDDVPGIQVRALNGSTREPAFEGTVIGFADFPTVVIETEDGGKRFWSVDLVEPVPVTVPPKQVDGDTTPECVAEREAGQHG